MPPATAVPSARSVPDEVAHRLDALVDAFEHAPPAAPRRTRPVTTPPPADHPATVADLQSQLDLLREQLEVAFDEVEQRIEVAESRAEAAELRAAELADAVAKVIDAVARAGATRANGAGSSPLRAALDELRQRLAAG